MFTAGIGQPILAMSRREPRTIHAGGQGRGSVLPHRHRGSRLSRVQDAKEADLDFGAVQRAAEMENKMNRLIRACVELGDDNPIISIHDQGAGGNSNVLKEIAEPAGCASSCGKSCS